MPPAIDIQRVRFLILGRLFLATLFLSLGNLVFDIQKVNFYFLIAFVYFISILYSICLKWQLQLLWLVRFQIILDLIMITGIVSVSGSSESIFSILYVLCIVSASMILSEQAGIVAAVLASILYIIGSWESLNEFIRIYHAENFNFRGPAVASIYKIYIHVISFILMGFLLSSLTRRMFQMEAKMRFQEHLVLVGEVSSEIAHEIRNPLASISGSIELLEERLSAKLEGENQKLFKAIIQESDRVSGILNQFLQYARSKEPEKDRIDLTSLLDETVFLLENNSRRKKDVVIQKKYTSQSAVWLQADLEMLKQVFINLIQNALEALDNKGTLEISLKTTLEQATIFFKDNGPGIQKSKISQLFLPFGSEKIKGTGLGLAISQKIVQLHGGRIEVESSNNGTTFSVVLPL